ncbi:MAG: GGDEF domain-containing protein [Deltaproteobacteria bacterium]|nr:GGDEF domain-containing protein [Deltaproteobacteria bacterium]
MAKVTSRQGSDAFADFLRLIELEAGRFPVDLVPVAGENGGAPQGLLIVDQALAETRKKELARSVTGGDGRTKPAPPLTLVNRPGGPESFHGLVQTELSRVKSSRLPCALLLIRFAGSSDGSLLTTAAAALKNEVRDGIHLAHYDQATFALLLPGLNRNRALHKARAIHHCLGAVAACQVKIGLAVCLARAVPGVEEFMAMAVRELHKSGHDTGGIFYSFQEETDDSCQVSAEERAQLFRFTGKGKK